MSKKPSELKDDKLKGFGRPAIIQPAPFDEIEMELPKEEEPEAHIPARRIYTDQGDPEVDSLWGKYHRGKLVVQPDFQRHFVWDSLKSSRLLESALLDIPLPVIYLSEEADGKEYVIDGQQRLTSFFAFMDGKFPSGKEFRLGGLRVFPDLNGKSFAELPDSHQDKLRYYKIRAITFTKDSDANLKFEIFERLNTGAVTLNDQELRNCIFRGPYNDLLKRLSENDDFRYLLGIDQPEKRMKDVELLLRFASFYHATYLRYSPPMRTFLNHDMEKYRALSSDESKRLEDAFKNAVWIIKSLLDKHAFKRYYKGDIKNKNGYWEPNKFNASLYDILMYQFATTDKNTVYQNLDSIREALIHLMTEDPEFIASIELSTSSVQAVTKRFDKWRLMVQDLIGIAQKEPRCFSAKLKLELYQTDPTCAICGQKILDVDDAAVDHIEQYWRGGKTIPENARLAHRFCNSARPRTDSTI